MLDALDFVGILYIHDGLSLTIGNCCEASKSLLIDIIWYCYNNKKEEANNHRNLYNQKLQYNNQMFLLLKKIVS